MTHHDKSSAVFNHAWQERDKAWPTKTSLFTAHLYSSHPRIAPSLFLVTFDPKRQRIRLSHWALHQGCTISHMQFQCVGELCFDKEQSGPVTRHLVYGQL